MTMGEPALRCVWDETKGLLAAKGEGMRASQLQKRALGILGETRLA